ncbi:hypothetical protein GDO86_003291 [Hymenochirus boettgeri]|uniref:Sushi domain-containing protein n=1 Tax=Hymenochirus boettgeri TaxID=247094 RepID=A0A8T2K0R6_9PIPI|nr:hypothetical protein GDO86_003291 [Hymenochirus boettgeri]
MQTKWQRVLLFSYCHNKTYCIQLCSYSYSLNCLVGDCGPPPRLDYAELKPEFNNQTFPIGQEVKYICRPGYVRSGSNDSIVCLNDSTWSTPFVFCTRRSCPNPGDIQNGQMEAEDFLFGSRVNYTCNIGYNMISKYNYRVCLADGTWSNSLPICQTVISCTEAGNWSSVAPSCKAVNCPNPIVPNAIKTSGFTGPYLLNYAVTFKCNDGFDMFGSSTVQCNIDSNWEPSLPECIGRCGLPPKLEYGQLKPEFTDQGSFSSGVRVEYDCAQGYLPVNGTNNTIICLNFCCNGSSSKIHNFCISVQLCTRPENIKGGDFTPQKGEYKYQDSVTYSCNSNFELVGNPTISCTASGKWSLGSPYCNAQLCTRPENIKGGDFTPQKGEYKYQDSVTYSCNSNFKLVGNPTISCTASGKWSSGSPYCNGQ